MKRTSFCAPDSCADLERRARAIAGGELATHPTIFSWFIFIYLTELFPDFPYSSGGLPAAFGNPSSQREIKVVCVSGGERYTGRSQDESVLASEWEKLRLDSGGERMLFHLPELEKPFDRNDTST
jgi:hypothetical protein